MFPWIILLDLLKLLLELGIKLLHKDRRQPRIEPDEHEPETELIEVPKRRAADRTMFMRVKK